MNKHAVVTLDINNYNKDITDITFPRMRQYANNIGADFICITEQKTPELAISLEKFQLYDIADNYEWIIFLDADCLIDPNTIDFTTLENDIVVVPSYNDVTHHFTTEKILGKYELDYYMPFFFLAFHSQNKNCVKPWKDISELEKYINMDTKTPDFVYYKNVRNDLEINPSWLLDELILDINIIKYGISTLSIREDFNFNVICHSIGSVEEKIQGLTAQNKKIDLHWELSYD